VARTDESETPSPRELTGTAAGFNVVLISVDTLRADRLGSYGYTVRDNSPQIDQLLEGGVLFESAQATRALTWPALASVLTGLMPSGHGVTANGYELAEGQPTLPLLLQAAGYETAAFLSNMCRANHLGWESISCAGGVDRRLNRNALAWLQERDPTRPFFLWTHYFGPHPPYYNGGTLAQEVLDPGYQGDLAPRARVLDRIMIEERELDDADHFHLDAIYDAAVMGTDRYVAELLEGLATTVDLSRTLIVFVADHGEDLYQHHGYLYHACSIYQTSLHVPLAFIAPGLLPEAARIPDGVSQIDILPTLLELLGIEPPACLHGRSLVPLMERPSGLHSATPILTEYGDGSRIQTVTLEGWKLISNPDDESPICFADAPADLYPIEIEELYRLSSDPLETQNLAPTEQERVLTLATQLAVSRQTQCVALRRQDQSIGDDLRRELEALGYVVAEP
jgi:arylsulfatase A-like enzyme